MKSFSCKAPAARASYRRAIANAFVFYLLCLTIGWKISVSRGQALFECVASGFPGKQQISTPSLLQHLQNNIQPPATAECLLYYSGPKAMQTKDEASVWVRERFQRMKKHSARVAPLPSYNVSELNSPVPDGKCFFFFSSFISEPRQGFTLHATPALFHSKHRECLCVCSCVFLK